MSSVPMVVLIQLLPKQGLAAADAAAIVREIREANPQTLTGIAGARLKVEGVPAFNIDYEDAVKRSLGIIAAIVRGTLELVARTMLIIVRCALIIARERGERCRGVRRSRRAPHPLARTKRA